LRLMRLILPNVYTFRYTLPERGQAEILRHSSPRVPQTRLIPANPHPPASCTPPANTLQITYFSNNALLFVVQAVGGSSPLAHPS
jgi:hypothetical protein